MTESTHDDVLWDDAIESLDLEAGDLAAAEARLRQAGDAPPSSALVAALLRHATPGRSALRQRRIQRWSRVAALLIGAALLGAAGYAYSVWASERRSRDTMTYGMAVELLARSDQPKPHRSSAMGKIVGRIGRSIATLRAIRDEAKSPPVLAREAGTGLAQIERLLSVQVRPSPQPLSADLDVAIGVTRDTGLDVETRRQGVARVISATVGDLGVLLGAPNLSPDMIESRRKAIAGFRRFAHGR